LSGIGVPQYGDEMTTAKSEATFYHLYVNSSVSAILLEDHPLFREGLKSYVLDTFPNVNFAYVGADVAQAKDTFGAGIDIAIVDLHLGDSRTPSEIVAIFASANIPVLVISALNNFESVRSAFSMGAMGFVSKDSSIDEIGKAIKSVLNQKEWVSPTLGRALAQSKTPGERLSAQEKRAMILYASGLKLDVVARRMEVAPSTVKQYIDRAKFKYRAAGIPVHTKTDIYKILRDEGLID
jgi:DNA-binding NarL/FixJ family response regulator